MKIEVSTILLIAPRCDPLMAGQLAQCLPTLLGNNGIDTPLRLAHFFAQTAHESAGFTRFTENLNYGVQGLMNTFPHGFNAHNAPDYAHQPEKIANFIYANRMGNGNTASGDGWKYRGRGMIQLTGKENYAEFSADKGIDAVKDPDYLSTVPGAALSAVWFWGKFKINALADSDNIAAITRLINGGDNGLYERIRLLSKAKNAFQASV
jgi:putative chitinase